MGDMLRITGLATGLDVDEMVKSMMKAENIKLDKLKQDRQMVQWKQDLYREIIGDLNTFKSTYFDVLKSDSYMLSPNNYAGFDITTSDGSTSPSTIVSASAGAGAAPGTYSVTVHQLAKAAAKEGMPLNGSRAVSDAASWSGKSISFSLDGGTASYTITLDGTAGSENYTISDITSLKDAINKEIASDTNLAGKISASVVTSGSSSYISFNVLTGSSVKITDTDADDLTNLKGRVINPTISTRLSDLGVTGPTSITLTYNGGTPVTINFEDTNTIGEVINAISSRTSGKMTVKFSELTKSFTLQTSDTGSGTSLAISGTEKLLSALGIDSGALTGIKGQDAKADIKAPGSSVSVTVVNSKNTFSIDGVTYNLLREDPLKTAAITLTSNPQKVYDRIKAFIDKYNEIIDKIQKKITEKKQYNYKPLTDDQKKEMKEDEIKKWEEKAKEGILKNDSSLQNMLYAMRKAFFDKVKDAGITLDEIGLSTDTNYLNGGKIIIDENKLKDAVQNRRQQVLNLLIKNSDTAYDPDHKNDGARYDAIGIFQRINDILKDYVRTTRDSRGNKGILVQKAGVVGDLSEIDNMISKQLKDDYDKRIDELTDKLIKKENKYYEQFAKLETAIQKFNQQSAWLSQQFMGGK